LSNLEHFLLLGKIFAEFKQMHLLKFAGIHLFITKQNRKTVLLIYLRFSANSINPLDQFHLIILLSIEYRKLLLP